MKINSSYGVEIRKAGGELSITLKIYREAVRVLSLFYDTVSSTCVSRKCRRTCADLPLRTRWAWSHRTGPALHSGRKAEGKGRPRSSGRERMRCPYFTGGTCTGKAKGTRPVSNFITGRTGCG